MLVNGAVGIQQERELFDYAQEINNQEMFDYLESLPNLE